MYLRNLWNSHQALIPLGGGVGLVRVRACVEARSSSFLRLNTTYMQSWPKRRHTHTSRNADSAKASTVWIDLHGLASNLTKWANFCFPTSSGHLRISPRRLPQSLSCKPLCCLSMSTSRATLSLALLGSRRRVAGFDGCRI
jgi:hypothetical protein